MPNVVTISQPDVIAVIEEAAKKLTGGNKTESAAAESAPRSWIASPTELDALIDELLALVDLGLNRAIVLDHDDIDDHQNQSYPRQRNQKTI